LPGAGCRVAQRAEPGRVSSAFADSAAGHYALICNLRAPRRAGL